MTLRTLLLALAVLALPTAAFLTGGQILEKWSGRAAVAPANQKPLNQRLHYSAEDARKYWKGFGNGLSRERLFLELDLIFPFLYGGGLAAGLLLAWVLLGRPFHPACLLAPALLGVLADWTENLVQLGQLKRFCTSAEAVQDGWIRVASAATAVKLVSLAGAVVLLLTLAGMVLVQARRAS